MSQYLDKDGASRIAENFLSKQAEQDAILKNLQFDLKEAEHALVKTIQGPAPLNIRALTRPLDDYVISGDTVQDGTPAPEAPVDVVGCGVRTENRLNFKEWASNVYVVRGTATVSGNSIAITSSGNQCFTGWNNTEYPVSARIPVTAGEVVTLSCTCDVDDNSEIWIFPNGMLSGNSHTRATNGSLTYTVPAGTTYLTFRLDVSKAGKTFTFSNIMLNTGSTPLPYEPYGYKLPLTVNGTEYPIYLGQVPTTRRIRKLVLDGTESTWLEYNNLNLFCVPDTSKDYRSQADGAICDSLPLVPRGDLTTNTFCWSSGTVGEFIININNYNLADLRTYLSSNPITIWYVLAEPETAIVNEPLHKIGDYADALSMAQAGVEISTTKGFNTITADTTVLPSNIEVKGVINNA